MSKSRGEYSLATLLLMSASISAYAAPALAQALTPPAAPAKPVTDAAAEDKSVEAIHVTAARRSIAGGLMKKQTAPEATSSITAAVIAKKPAAASPLQLISTLPGVNFGSSNAYGLEIRNFLNVRGLEEEEMGWVVEGMPGTDQALNYPYTEAWADVENIADMTLIPGTTRLHDPVETASGGEVIMTLRDPSDKAGGMVSSSVGSYAAQRYFLRLDSGYIGDTGIKMYGSYSYEAANNFTDSGRSHKQHVDFKATKDWGTRGTSKLWVSYTDWTDARLNTYSLAQWEKANAVGNNWSVGNYANTYIPGKSVNYWLSSIYKTKRIMMSIQNDIAINDQLSVHITPYFHWVDGNGGGLSQFSLSSLYTGNQKAVVDPSEVVLESNGKFAAISSQFQQQYAVGINAVLQYDITQANTLRLGYWYDHWNMNQFNPLYPADLAGNSLNYLLRDSQGRIVTGTRYQDSQQINDINIADTQKFLNDKLQVNVGFKQLMTYVSGTDQVPGPLYHFSAAISQPLPRVSISYSPTPTMQVYVNGTTNIKPPIPINAYPNDYSVTTGKLSQFGNTHLRPEYTIGEELGYRYYGLFNADLALFNMNLTNHQVNTAQNQNGLLVQQAISVGGETIQGASLELATHPYFGFSPYGNVQYLHTSIDNNLAINGTYLPTAGKEMVESPKWIGNIGINYDRGPFFASLIFKYVDSQYSTFMNDQSMPAYKTVDVALGYRLPEWGLIKQPTLRLNMTNLSDVPYLGTVAGPQPNAKATKALNGTTIAGTAPTYYISAPFAIMLTLSAAF